ncbi:MAG TPA: enoyl-CoA hydratase-related protein [Dehalococcoidia bacterium]|jgi:enoyl-CoA hydratase|nr:enoyl-CoA hydratase-related protein [Dehalococcoidia bacterium]
MAEDYTAIIYRTEERIARITLNRPEKRNALNPTIRNEIVDALQRAERDDDVVVVLIDGAGPSFCSGYDITPGGGPGARRTEFISAKWFDGWTDQFTRSCLRDWLTIWDLLKPVVAKVHGHCLAGGTELASMCDIVFAADDATFGYPPMRGMTTPDVPYFPWKMTMARAKYLQLSGNGISGKLAAEWGWIAKSFPPDQLEAETMKEVRALATISPDLLAANKLNLNQTYEIMGFRAALSTAPQWHALSSRLRPGGGDFGRISQEQGLRAALEWRDGAFRKVGL